MGRSKSMIDNSGIVKIVSSKSKVKSKPWRHELATCGPNRFSSATKQGAVALNIICEAAKLYFL